MPRPALPPTPASSTDIAAKDGQHLSGLEASFSLPSPAIVGKDKSGPSEAASRSAGSNKRPCSPVSPEAIEGDNAATRRRPSMAQAGGAGKEDFTLPPPPTRSRKIIQMKPRPQEQAPMVPSSAPAKSSSKTAAGGGGNGKKKSPSTTSVAGRKIARKTAHSLIERRRRSKMNEEFGVLKQMIPACKDQEMHKLAILQASIEYTRYLEQCILDLKNNSNPNVTPAATYPSFAPSSAANEPDEDDEDGDGDGDEPDEMEGVVDSATPTREPERRQSDASYSQSESPMLAAQRHYSYSSHSAATSPTFGPQRQYSYTSHSTSASPALLPQRRDGRDFDHEATEALLLLNTDRRNKSARGMSVRDLLSS
ncbi:MAG: hypothetical protein M1832_004854 [Thelocarpon impressellum]|nr:MAG: hypothetical protein M1832_004854 [Thelocarpon impressellum]